MAVRIYYTNHEKQRYANTQGVIPANLVSLSDKRCAVRATLQAIPGENGVFAELPTIMEGRVTSIGARLVARDPSGAGAILTTVSPALDRVGAYLYAFLEDIPISTVGPPMYRRTSIRDAFYCTDKMSKPQHIYIIIPNGTGLAGTLIDVGMTVDTH